jgi:2-hydroxycyclohexanecarboxyl-CoA dehydrogenase
MDIKGKAAIVTGSASGIGKGIARKLAQYGANVVIADINDEMAGAVAKEISEEFKVNCIRLNLDVTKVSSCENLAKETIAKLGGIDILVNNAGGDRAMPFWETTEDFRNWVIDFNFKGPVNLCHAVIPHMMEKKAGKIVNIGSDAGRVGSSGETVYAGCKGGVIAFTKSLARELARYQINVNCVCPGPTDTPGFVEGTTEKLREALKRAIPFRRIGQPEDIGNGVLYFASGMSDFVTGQVLSVSGGLTMAG